MRLLDEPATGVVSARSVAVERSGHTRSLDPPGASPFRRLFLRDSTKLDDRQVLPPVGACQQLRDTDRSHFLGHLDRLRHPPNPFIRDSRRQP